MRWARLFVAVAAVADAAHHFFARPPKRTIGSLSIVAGNPASGVAFTNDASAGFYRTDQANVLRVVQDGHVVGEWREGAVYVPYIGGKPAW